jgi:hypothetical protein
VHSGLNVIGRSLFARATIRISRREMTDLTDPRHGKDDSAH